jgi:hypothetical protein
MCMYALRISMAEFARTPCSQLSRSEGACQLQSMYMVVFAFGCLQVNSGYVHMCIRLSHWGVRLVTLD